MGQPISTVIKSIDGGDASSRSERGTLNALFALGQSRSDRLHAEAVSGRGKVYAPISNIILRKQSIVCNASAGTKDIVDGIKKTYGNMLVGQILGGVTDLVQNALNKVLSPGADQISSTYTYALIATELGALFRLDIDIYSFALESQWLRSKVKNMTAVSTLVSSVDANALSSGDIRAMVSISYGFAEEELAESILQITLSAWDVEKKKLSGLEITSEDLAAHKALFIPTPHETSAANTPSTDVQSNTPSKPKVDRKSLIRKFRKTQAAEKDSSDKLDHPDPTRLAIIVLLCKTADQEFLQHLVSTLIGFNINGIFSVSDYHDGISGTAIGINCKVNDLGNSSLFDTVVAYVNDTVFPALATAGYLNEWIRDMALQYKHPKYDVEGVQTRLSFRDNQMINYSHQVISFYEPGTNAVLLNLGAAIGETPTRGVLNGVVDHVVGSRSGKGREGGGEGGEGTETEIPTRWVTYQEVKGGMSLTGMEASIYDIETGGFVLRFVGRSDENDKQFELEYNVGWERLA